MANAGDEKTRSPTITAQEHIANLNAIDHEIPEALAIASKVIALLPNDDYNTTNPQPGQQRRVCRLMVNRSYPYGCYPWSRQDMSTTAGRAAISLVYVN